jgi:hypothetical protein
MKASWSELPMRIMRDLVAIICAAMLVPGDMSSLARPVSPQAAAPTEEAARIPAEQLDSLVAPIALYPDPMLSQTLVASTYPLEIIQLQQWLEKNKNLKDKALVDAVKKQDWDPSIQGMAALPEVVKQLAENIKWTTDLGNAFLAQQSDVMDAVQRMRKKANDAGNLKSSEQQKVETKVIESKQVIVIEQASPQVVYVPSYNPTVVYGPPVYPYPPIAYPPVGYYAAGMAISFGVGLAMGAAWGGGWGYGAGWGHNDVNVNVNNNFNRNTNISNSGNRAAAKGGNTSWQHNPQHRGGAPYSNRATANKYGGSARGDSMASRQDRARESQGQRGQQANARDRSASGGRQQAGVSDRSAGGRQQASGSDRTAGGRDSGNRGPSVADRSSNRTGGGGGDRVGNRSTSSGSGARSSSAFGGGSGNSARASSSRGSSSFGGGSGSRGSRGGGRRR